MRKYWHLVLLLFLLTSCNLNADAHFYEDQTWQVDADFKYYDLQLGGLNQALAPLNDVLQANGIETVLSLPDTLDEKPFVEALLRELVTKYGSKQIDASWQLTSDDPAGGVMYALRASGRSWQSFEDLIPGAITLTPGPDNKTLKVTVELGEANALASAVLQETIRVHGGEIIVSNAPVERSGYAQWPNPARMEVELTPESSVSKAMGQVPWVAVIVVIVIVALLVAGYLGYRYYVYG